MDKAGIVVSACFLVILGWMAYVLNVLAYMSHSVVFQLIFLSVGVLIGAFAVRSGRMTATLVPSLYILWILALPYVNSSPVKAAVLAVDEIRLGMSEPEVRAVLHHRFPVNGPFKRPEFGPLKNGVISFALDPNDGRYNAAIVVVRFSAGKVVSAEFLPD